MYEVELTTMYRQHYQRLNSKFQRFAREAQEILKEYPTDYQGRILNLTKNREKEQHFRYRMPGGYFIFYVLSPNAPIVTLTGIHRHQ
jgi:mRNA-degrading endonuclease RelE of RelBE toxin-antitoxin system